MVHVQCEGLALFSTTKILYEMDTKPNKPKSMSNVHSLKILLAMLMVALMIIVVAQE